jgi:hypothetical protein
MKTAVLTRSNSGTLNGGARASSLNECSDIHTTSYDYATLTLGFLNLKHIFDECARV